MKYHDFHNEQSSKIKKSPMIDVCNNIFETEPINDVKI